MSLQKKDMSARTSIPLPITNQSVIKMNHWRWRSNHFRRHSALDDLSPQEFTNLYENTLETATYERSG